MTKHSLAKKLALSFAAIAMVSAYLTSVMSNYLISRQFDHYLSAHRQEREIALVRELEALITDGDQVSQRSLQNISGAAMADHVHIQIFDAEGYLLWEEGPWGMHHHMMGGFNDSWLSHMEEATYNLTSQDGQHFGQVVFGYVTAMLTPAQVGYARSIWLAGIIGAAAAAGVGVASGWFASLFISKPLRTLTRTINAFRGNRRANPLVVSRYGDEINDLTQAFADFQSSLEEQETHREQLTADVAHELRTPLAALRAQLEAMQDGVYEVTQERLASCHRDVLRLTGLVDDVESLASLEAAGHKINKQRCNLAEIAEEAAEGFMAVCAKAGLTLNVDTKPAYAYVDAGRIRQVVVNLLSNTIKYVPRGSTVRLSVKPAPGKVQIIVEDNGKGIPESDLPHIFKRFYRGDKSRNRKSGGAGLGLAITRAIVGAHDGRITVENLPTSGARFMVEIPVGYLEDN